MSRFRSIWSGKHSAIRWWVLAQVLFLVGAGFLWAGLIGHRISLNPAASSARHVLTPSAFPIRSAPALAVAPSVPVTLSIPAIGLGVTVTDLGLNPDGTVQVPSDIQQAGWYRLGPSPGQLGSAVILGHIDSYQGPAVFFNLRQLQAGDPVYVTLADGVTVNFVVTSIAMYDKTQFPDQQVYGSNGTSALQLVTCGGTFDPQTGHYLSNLVVYTSFVSATSPAS